MKKLRLPPIATFTPDHKIFYLNFVGCQLHVLADILRVLMDFKEVGRVILGHFQAHALSQSFHCLAEIEPFVVHHEAERVPPSAAAKAVEKLLVRTHGKRRCFLVVKGAAGFKFFTGFLYLNPSSYNLTNIGSLYEVINKILRNSFGHKLKFIIILYFGVDNLVYSEN